VARVDISILREIVRVVEALAKVPDVVTLNKRRFQLTYLEDHRQRLEEALRRHDRNQLNMLFGQLASKVKYQAVRLASAAMPKSRAAAPAPAAAPAAAARKKKAKTPSRAAPAKKATAARTASKKKK